MDRYPPTLDLGPQTSLALRCTSVPAHVPTNKDSGPLTFVPKDGQLFIAAHYGLTVGRIVPDSALLYSPAPNEDPCSNDWCGLMCAIAAMAEITVQLGFRA